MHFVFYKHIKSNHATEIDFPNRVKAPRSPHSLLYQAAQKKNRKNVQESSTLSQPLLRQK